MNIDQLIYTTNFGSQKTQAQAQLDIWNLAQNSDNVPASIAPIYWARGQEKLLHNFTVPAFNLRGLTYQVAQEIFKQAQKNQVGLFIFELARSEMSYTGQSPAIYVSNILAAAIKTKWNQPIFIQTDHFQVKQNQGQIDPQDLESLKLLIKQAIQAGFYNIDLDGSPLITKSQSLNEQQQNNASYVAMLSNYIRTIEPTGIHISLGGEIGEIGSQHNSTTTDVTAFMDLFLAKFGQQAKGLSKLAVQTGTSHGGVVDPQGKVMRTQVAFENIKKLSQFCRQKYGLGGVVQHGASTLSPEEFTKFPAAQAIEIHLATGLQNIIFDHPSFPTSLLTKIYAWIDQNLSTEKKSKQSTAQFHYKLRKKAWKEFGQEIFTLDEKTLAPILQTLSEKFDFYFNSLGVNQTNKIVTKYIQPIKIEHQLDDYLISNNDDNQSSHLAD